MQPKRLLCLLFAAVLTSLVLISVASAAPVAATPQAQELVKAAAITPAPAFTAADLNAYAGDNWLNSGGGIHDDRYSTLTQINKSNVANLKTAWNTSFDLPAKTAAATSEEGSPTVYNGVLYIPNGQSEVYAVDGTTGAHALEVLTGPRRASADLPAIRGLALGDGKVYEAQGDGNIVALEPADRRGRVEVEGRQPV